MPNRFHKIDDLMDAIENPTPVKDELEPILEALPIVKKLQTIHPENERAFSDQMMGRLYAQLFGNELRYNVTAKEWEHYNGRFWEIDTGSMKALKYAKLLTDAMQIYATQTNNRDFIINASRYGQLQKRKTMVEDARSEIFISNADLDGNGNYFNCQNGTFDLTNYELLPHNPEHLISKISNVIYDPDVRSEDWERFMSDVMQGNQNLILYMQKLAGLTLTADTSLEMLWLLYGATTRNGKSTFTETLAYMHGNSAGYALMMSPETLAQRKTKDTRQASGDIARLNGCRYLNASEPPKKMLFDAALIKQLTGRDTVVARHLMEREFEFTPQFKLLINTNYLPRIQDDTLFESGRIVVIPFKRHFTPEEQDEGLKDRLRKPENISGLFNWCVEGLRLYRETGLTAPEELKAATAEYRKNSDKISLFIEEELEKSERNSSAGAIYKKFASWCDENGYGTESKRSFFDELKNKGLFAESGTVNGLTVRNIIKGYELLSDYD